MTPPPRHKNQRINETSCFFIELMILPLAMWFIGIALNGVVIAITGLKTNFYNINLLLLNYYVIKV
jgi:hypothetical protein